MQLLSLNEIRSLMNRLPPSKNVTAFARAVETQAAAWAVRLRRPHQSLTVTSTELEQRWSELQQGHTDHVAAVLLAQQLEAMVLGSPSPAPTH